MIPEIEIPVLNNHIKIVENNVNKNIKPLVFIGHDNRDADLAEAFSNLLKSVSAGVLKSFRSSDKKGKQGIEYGVEWYPEIIKNIQEASDVVCLLTQNSINRPWILFEAGMAKGKLDTKILGIALGIPLKNVSTGPFAQFQNCGDDEDSLTKLVFQLVDRIPNSEPDEETIKFQVKNFKIRADEILKNREKESIQEEFINEEKDYSTSKLFEEIKVMFQELPSRIEKGIYVDYDKKRKMDIHPVIIDEIIQRTRNKKNGLIIALCLFKDSPIPWLYDLGVELIKKFDIEKSRKKGDIDKLDRDIRDLEMMIDMFFHGPMISSLSTKEYTKLIESATMIFEHIRRYFKIDMH